MRIFHHALIAATVSAFPLTSYAGCFSECCNTHRVNSADALVEAEVLELSTFLCEETSIVHTRATLNVVDKLTGKQDIPQEITLVYPGGVLGQKKSFDSRSLKLKKNEQYFIYLTQNDDLEWSAYQAHAEKVDKRKAKAQRKFYKKLAKDKKEPTTVTTQEDVSFAITEGESKSKITTYGYTEYNNPGNPSDPFNGMPGRLTLADSSQMIQVEVDTQHLPSGVTNAQALTAVRNALDAWESASSLSFKITSNYNFGQAASAMDGENTTIHIQFHDTFDPISGSTTLGIGGGSISTASGGSIDGVNFLTALSRYVVLNHDAATLQDLEKLEQVLTHEVGHAIGLSHSSESSSESDSDLAEATMYYRVHNDGRGAALQPYDTNQMVIGYPSNTPPVGSDHYLRAITRSSGQATPLANIIQLNGFDADGDSLTYTLTSSATVGTGSLTLDSNTGEAAFTSSAAFSGGDTTSSNSSAGYSGYGRFTYTISDGVHTSPEYEIRLVALVPDFSPASELPSSWVSTHFGGSTPSHTADPDGDGANNLQEFIRDTDPNDGTDGAISLSFDLENDTFTLPSLLHGDKAVIESSTDLSTWNTVTSIFQSEPTAPENATVYIPLSDSESKIFYRANITR